MFLADGAGFPLIKGNPLPQPIQQWIEKHPKLTVCGTVYRREDTEYSEAIYLKNSYIIYQSENISINNVKVYMQKKTEVPPGAVIVVSGNLKEAEKARNPGGFDEQIYYASQHIFYLMQSGKLVKISENASWNKIMLSKIREGLSEILENIAKEDAPLFQAMLLGEKRDLDTEIKTMYQMAGIIHILAISGLHISMLGMGLYQILKKTGVGLMVAGMVSLFVMIQYGMMTGSGVSTLRAVCMFLLNVGAQMLGRIYDLPTALAVAAIVLLVESPANLYNSSFQLSFGAVAAIGLIVPMVNEIWKPKYKWTGAVLSSGVVQLVTLPVILKTYGEVSVLGVVWNLLVIPTVGMVLFSGTAGSLLGSISFLLVSYQEVCRVLLKAAEIAILPGRFLLGVYEMLCEVNGRFSFTVWIAGEPENWQVLLYYGILGGLLILGCYGRSLLERKKRKQMVKVMKLCLLAGIMINCAMLGISRQPEFRITCLDVGQGDGCIMQTAEGEHILIDCGSSSEKQVGKYCLIPFLKHEGISFLDAVLVSHTDQDHISGIEELLEQIGKHLTAIRVGKVILPEWNRKNEAYERLEQLAEYAGAELMYANEGDIVSAEAVKMKIFRPVQGSEGTDTNEEGMVLEVQNDDFCGLFMGDVGEEVEKSLLSQVSEVDFLKVGHHGSAYSTCEEFLDRISPEIAVISCSTDNSYGHPAAETVERLYQSGSQVEYTMKHGAITIVVQENQMKTERFLAF